MHVKLENRPVSTSFETMENGLTVTLFVQHWIPQVLQMAKLMISVHDFFSLPCLPLTSGRSLKRQKLNYSIDIFNW